MSFWEEQGKLKALTFSYDDGITQDIRLIELLNRYGLKCTFNLNSEFLSLRGTLMRNGKRIAHYKIHKEDVRRIYEGHEVAVHTLTHPSLAECEDAEVIRQVEQDRLNLSELAGYEVVGMAYPNGSHDERVAGLIREHTGVKYSRTVTSTENFDLQENLIQFNPTVKHLSFDTMMALGQKFVDLKPDKPQIFYVWGHAYEMDYEEDYWVRLEEFCKLVSGKDDIFYGTNKEVLL